jgi:hypothetical protein
VLPASLLIHEDGLFRLENNGLYHAARHPWGTRWAPLANVVNGRPPILLREMTEIGRAEPSKAPDQPEIDTVNEAVSGAGSI